MRRIREVSRGSEACVVSRLWLFSSFSDTAMQWGEAYCVAISQQSGICGFRNRGGYEWYLRESLIAAQGSPESDSLVRDALFREFKLFVLMKIVMLKRMNASSLPPLDGNDWPATEKSVRRPGLLAIRQMWGRCLGALLVLAALALVCSGGTHA